MSKKSRFQRGAGGVFKCQCCERSTRVVDQSSDSRCCPECWELAGIDNSVNDGHQSWDEVASECNHLLEVIVKKGGNAENVKSDCDYLWPIS
jgi:hypothetical protein